MDNSAANNNPSACQTWMDQNGWPTSSSQGLVNNPLTSSQHLRLHSLCDQTSFYTQQQASGQSCMSSVENSQNAAHLDTIPSNSLFYSTPNPSAPHLMSFAQQVPHTSKCVATCQGKPMSPPSSRQPNNGVKHSISQNPPPLSANSSYETFHIPLFVQGSANRLPDQSSTSYDSSTSQKQARWMPSSQSKGAAVPSASYSDELVNKQQEKDVPSVADIEKRRSTILKQRAQLLQQLENVDVLLESLPPSNSSDKQLSHKTVQSQHSANRSPSLSCDQQDSLSDKQKEPVSPAESVDQQVEKSCSESEDENESNYKSTSDGNVSDCVSEDTTDSEDYPAEDTACKKEAGEEESTTQTNTQKPSETVVVPISHQKGKRIFDKKNYCLFCSKPVLKMSRHLTVIHSDRAEVAVAFQHPVHSKERTQIWKKLIKAGNFAHNKYVLQTGKGQLAVQARPTKPQKATDYVHCVYCFGNFAKKNVWRHLKTCSEKPEKANETKDKRPRLVTQCAILTKNCENLSEGFKNVLCEMQYDDVTEAVIKDQILLQFGEQMFSEYSDDVKNHQYIRQNLRLVARLLLEAQKSTPMRTLEDFFQPSNFKHVVSAVKSVAGYDPETKTFTTPSLAFKVGYNLQKICSVVERTAVKYGDTKAEEACKIFQSLYQKKWNKHISSRAFRNLKETKKKNKDDAPFVEDVKRLHDHLEKVHRDAEEKLKENVCSENYLALAKVVLAQILVFNKRKAREVTSISLTAFRSRKKSDLLDDMDVSVSDLEKTLCGFFSRVDIKGNCGRMLPVLLKPSFESAIELLISVREECGVPKDNPFVFGIPSPFPSSTLKRWVCTQIFVKECGAEKPAALTLPKLRQHFATMMSKVYLSDDEFRQIFGPKRQTQAVHGDAGVECDDQHHDLSSSLFGPECLGHKQETTTISFTAEYNRKYGKALRCKTKPKWDEAEVRAVEKHLMRFIQEHKLPQKVDCVRCLEAEPRALRNRSWKGLKDYVRNRITTLQRESGASKKLSKTRKITGLKRTQKSSVRSQPSNKLEAAREHHGVVPSSNVEPTQRPHGATTYNKASTPKSKKSKAKPKWDEAEVTAIEKHLMSFIKEHRLPQKDDCIRCLEAEPCELGNRSWKGVKDYVRNRITALQRQSCSSKTSKKRSLGKPTEPRQTTVTSEPSNSQETVTEHQHIDTGLSCQQKHGVTTKKSAAPTSDKAKGLQQKSKHKWDEEEIRAVEEHLMHFIKKQKVPQKDDCVLCLEAEPDALRNRSWKGIKDYVRNRITTLQRQSGSSTNSAKYYR
nr:uncharacterized protein LOC129152239 [Nothobranchius furzeri]